MTTDPAATNADAPNARGAQCQHNTARRRGRGEDSGVVIDAWTCVDCGVILLERNAAPAMSADAPNAPVAQPAPLDELDMAALNELERDLAANEVEHMSDVWKRLRAILDAPQQRALAARLAAADSQPSASEEER